MAPDEFECPVPSAMDDYDRLRRRRGEGMHAPPRKMLLVDYDRNEVPGWEGSIGPFPYQYGKPHVYARDIHSGAGNCVCGRSPGSPLHVQIAPGVDVPDHMRRP